MINVFSITPFFIGDFYTKIKLGRFRVTACCAVDGGFRVTAVCA